MKCKEPINHAASHSLQKRKSVCKLERPGNDHGLQQ